MKLLAALLLCVATSAHAFVTDQRIVVILGDGGPAVSWVGTIVSLQNNVYTFMVDHAGDTLFVDSVEPMDFGHVNPDTGNGWAVRYETSTGNGYIGGLPCGRWLKGSKLVVINCNVVQP